LLKIITPSLIKRSLQLNALEIYDVVVQRRRFIRPGTLFFFGARRFQKFADKNEIFGIVGRRTPLPKYYPR